MRTRPVQKHIFKIDFGLSGRTGEGGRGRAEGGTFQRRRYSFCKTSFCFAYIGRGEGFRGEGEGRGRGRGEGIETCLFFGKNCCAKLIF